MHVCELACPRLILGCSDCWYLMGCCGGRRFVSTWHFPKFVESSKIIVRPKGDLQSGKVAGAVIEWKEPCVQFLRQLVTFWIDTVSALNLKTAPMRGRILGIRVILFSHLVDIALPCLSSRCSTDQTPQTKQRRLSLRSLDHWALKDHLKILVSEVLSKVAQNLKRDSGHHYVKA